MTLRGKRKGMRTLNDNGKPPENSGLIFRSFANYRAESTEDGMAHITGVPIVYEQPTDIGGWFEETVARGAIDETTLKNVDLFLNHDRSAKPLARTQNGRLSFKVKEDGVHMDAVVNLKRSDANDLYIAIQDGDIDGMSFAFRVAEQEWKDLDTDYPKRRITKINYVQEVSAVNYPAYKGTSIHARSALSDCDRSALDEARAQAQKGGGEPLEDVELEKLKAKYLYGI